MITLYHAPKSRSSRIIWLLEELDVPYEIRPVSIFRPMTGEGAPDTANPHPDKRVPALEHNGQLVAESVAIVLYLTDAFPAALLGPAAGDAMRGSYLTWLAWYAAELEPAMFAGFGQELAGSSMKKRGYDAVMRRLDEALARGPYVMGAHFSGADLLIASAIAFGRKVFPDSPELDAYIERCKSRPAAVRGLALDDASGRQQAA
ncbi:MAG: glutathione S-transferase family protein [Methylovirgula sp.]